MANVTNAEIIKAYADMPQQLIEGFGDEGDLTRQYLLNPAISQICYDMEPHSILARSYKEQIMKLDATASVGFSPERLERIHTVMQEYLSRGELAGMATLVVHRGRTVHQATFGLRDREGNRPVTDDTIFAIASMTKPITAVAVMMLYEEGHFNLNTPIARFIPDFKDTKVFVRETASGIELAELEQPITIRHLFTHTAGLSYGSAERDPVDKLYRKVRQSWVPRESSQTMRVIIGDLAKLPLAHQPGSKWRYGLNIDVLGHLVEMISGMELDEFLRRRIFDPLGMSDTAYVVPPAKLDRLATIYRHTQESPDLQRWDFPPPTERPVLISGGGGLFSTIHDYARFAQMLVNRGILEGVRLLSPSTVALIGTNHAPAAALPYGFVPNDTYHAGYGYGLGVRVLIDVAASGQVGSVGEFGWDGAFNTYFWIDPQEELFGLLMVQHHPNAYYPIAQQFKALTYQALVDRS